MRKTDCSICDLKQIAWNDTIKVDGMTYCVACYENHFSEPEQLQNRLIERDFDPTICSACGNDFGSTELKKIGSYPMCDNCEKDIKNKTFPIWVKGFFIGILVIVVGSFFWNWKFYTAYSNIKASNEQFQKGDFSKAAFLMRSASEKVPEVEDIKTISDYFSGIELLNLDKCSEALEAFYKCEEKLPPDYNVSTLIIQARIGSNFDKKDYAGFLQASKENLALDTTAAVSLTSVASAYACLFANSGKAEEKEYAIQYLNKAKQIDSTSLEMKEYYNMVEYRLDSRNIIKREDFIKQFPNGWTKN